MCSLFTETYRGTRPRGHEQKLRMRRWKSETRIRDQHRPWARRRPTSDQSTTRPTRSTHGSARGHSACADVPSHTLDTTTC